MSTIAVYTADTQKSIDDATAGLAQVTASIANLDAFYLLVVGIFVFFMQASGAACQGPSRLAPGLKPREHRLRA